MRKLVMAAALVGVLAGCGGSTGKNPAGAGTAGGNAGGSVGGNAGGMAGAPGSGGTPPVTDCGGDLVGSWVAQSNDVQQVYPKPMVNQCWNLQGSFSEGRYFASSRYPYPENRVVILQFRADGSYVRSESLQGPIAVEYAPECLKTAGGTPTCEQLQATLLESGLGEGSYRDTMCSATAVGGCRCTVQVLITGGESGQWALAGQGSIQLTRRSADGTTMDTRRSTYQACDPALHFDAAIDAWWRYASRLTLHRPDCTDAQKGPGEQDVDCGGVCDFACQ